MVEELVGIYQRISMWALTRDDKNEQYYLYRNALSEEYLLKAELNRYYECMELIADYLKDSHPKSISLNDAQC